MTKPLYLTYTNGAEPWYDMAKKLCEQIKNLDAGNSFNLCLDEPGLGRSFFPEVFVRLYPKITQAIEMRPVIVLDADHKLRKPIIGVFSGDWDIAAVYRGILITDHGRQDYNAGFVMLNNRRPNVIRRFFFEWMYRSIISDWDCWNPYWPTLMKQKWAKIWWESQSALNEIIALEDENTVELGRIYTKGRYRILPLDRTLYADRGSIFIVHYKGNCRGRKK